MSTTAKPVHIDTSKFWNYIFPISLFIVGGFGFHVVYSLSDVQTTGKNAFNKRGATLPTLNLGGRRK